MALPASTWHSKLILALQAITTWLSKPRHSKDVLLIWLSKSQQLIYVIHHAYHPLSYYFSFVFWCHEPVSIHWQVAMHIGGFAGIMP